MELAATGYGRIDEGHNRLMALLEKLRYNPDNLPRIIQELGERLQAHFEEEEALMRAVKYRGAKAHAAEHRALAEILTREMPEEIGKAGNYEAVLGIVDRSRQAFMDHVLGLDHKLALFLIRREQAAEKDRRKKKPGTSTRAAKPGKVKPA
jgi:hemerythrin-like metal-binding protein